MHDVAPVPNDDSERTELLAAIADFSEMEPVSMVSMRIEVFVSEAVSVEIKRRGTARELIALLKKFYALRYGEEFDSDMYRSADESVTQ